MSNQIESIAAEINKEIDSYKKIVISTDPSLMFLIEESAEDIAKQNNKDTFKELAKLLDVPFKGKELEIVKNIQAAYNKIISE